MTEQEQKQWNREIANIIWLKIKGVTVPESYTDRQIEDVLSRYWHRAMEKDQ